MSVMGSIWQTNDPNIQITLMKHYSLLMDMPWDMYDNFMWACNRDGGIVISWNIERTLWFCATVT